MEQSDLREIINSRVAGVRVQVPNEIKLGHYTNKQSLLLVGDGNFSFALSLAAKFGSATNIVATTFDNELQFNLKYGMRGWMNVSQLSYRGALVLFEFDARNSAHMEQSLCGVKMSCFDRIIYHFPHAGFFPDESGSTLRETNLEVIGEHVFLVRSFLTNARRMLYPGGEIHVTHKLGHPYDAWKLEKQAALSGLQLKAIIPFDAGRYPGYHRCRGGVLSAKASTSFNISNSGTYVFVIRTDNAHLPFRVLATEARGAPTKGDVLPNNSLRDSISSIDIDIRGS